MTVYLKLHNESNDSTLMIRDTIEPGRNGDLELVFVRGLLEMSVTLDSSNLLRVQAALCRDGRIPKVGFNAPADLSSLESHLKNALFELDFLSREIKRLEEESP